MIRRCEASGAGMVASHPLPQSAGFAITSDLANVVGSPSRMASCFTSNVSQNVRGVEHELRLNKLTSPHPQPFSRLREKGAASPPGAFNHRNCCRFDLKLASKIPFNIQRGKVEDRPRPRRRAEFRSAPVKQQAQPRTILSSTIVVFPLQYPAESDLWDDRLAAQI